MRVLIYISGGVLKEIKKLCVDSPTVEFIQYAEENFDGGLEHYSDGAFDIDLKEQQKLQSADGLSVIHIANLEVKESDIAKFLIDKIIEEDIKGFVRYLTIATNVCTLFMIQNVIIDKAKSLNFLALRNKISEVIKTLS
jgi:hypothetical protein